MNEHTTTSSGILFFCLFFKYINKYLFPLKITLPLNSSELLVVPAQLSFNLLPTQYSERLKERNRKMHLIMIRNDNNSRYLKYQFNSRRISSLRKKNEIFK